MTLTQKNQLLIASKKLAGKSHTSSKFGIANEAFGTSIQVDSAGIFADTIPEIPDETLYETTNNIVQKVEFVLEEIPLTQYLSDTTATKTSIEADGNISDNTKFHAYALKLKADYTTLSAGKHPKVGIEPFVNGASLTGSSGTLQIVPSRFGSKYYEKVYSSSDVIGAFDDEDYYLDTYAGILFLQDPARVPSKVEAYIYIGNFLGGPGGVSRAGGGEYAIQFNSGSLLSGSQNLTYNYNTDTFSTTNIEASSISASVYIGIQPDVAGPIYSIQFNDGTKQSGSENLTYNYDTNVFRIQGSEGELFTVNNNLTVGTIFSVNDVSGIPSIEVDADGTVSIAEFGGNVGIGASNPTNKLEVSGNISVDGALFFKNSDSELSINDTSNIGNISGTGFVLEEIGAGGTAVFHDSNTLKIYVKSLAGDFEQSHLRVQINESSLSASVIETDNITVNDLNLENYDSLFSPSNSSPITVWRNEPGVKPYWGFITEDMIVKLVSISYFNIDGTSQREVGLAVTNPTFTTVVANESNVSATIQNNKDSTITSFVYSGTSATGVGSTHSYGAGNTGISDSWTFTLTVTSTTSPTYTKTATTSFLWGRYMYWGTNTTGISTNGALTENFVKTLDSSQNGSKALVGQNILGVASNSKTFNNVPAASYAYAAYPNTLLASPTGIRIGSFDYKIATGDCIDLGTINISREHDNADPILYRVLRVTSDFTADSNNPQVMTVIST